MPISIYVILLTISYFFSLPFSFISSYFTYIIHPYPSSSLFLFLCVPSSLLFLVSLFLLCHFLTFSVLLSHLMFYPSYDSLFLDDYIPSLPLFFCFKFPPLPLSPFSYLTLLLLLLPLWPTYLKLLPLPLTSSSCLILFLLANSILFFYHFRFSFLFSSHLVSSHLVSSRLVSSFVFCLFHSSFTSSLFLPHNFIF